MRVEILFPEVCNLYGDLQNVYYLKRCCPALEIVETDLHSKPRFLDEDITPVSYTHLPCRTSSWGSPTSSWPRPCSCLLYTSRCV